MKIVVTGITARHIAAFLMGLAILVVAIKTGALTSVIDGMKRVF